jgi:hypothetical protein
MVYPPVPLFKRTTLYLTSTLVQGRLGQLWQTCRVWRTRARQDLADPGQ